MPKTQTLRKLRKSITYEQNIQALNIIAEKMKVTQGVNVDTLLRKISPYCQTNNYPHSNTFAICVKGGGRVTFKRIGLGVYSVFSTSWIGVDFTFHLDSNKQLLQKLLKHNLSTKYIRHDFS